MYYDQGPLDFPSRQPTYSGATFLAPSTPPSIPPSMQRAMAMGFGPNQQGGRRGVSYADYYNGRSGGSMQRRQPSWQQLLKMRYPMGLGHGTGGSRTQTPTYMPFRNIPQGRYGGSQGGSFGSLPMPDYAGQDSVGYAPVARGGDGQYTMPQMPRYNMPRSTWNGPQLDQMVPYL
jgi:hypothetical protein